MNPARRRVRGAPANCELKERQRLATWSRNLRMLSYKDPQNKTAMIFKKPAERFPQMKLSSGVRMEIQPSELRIARYLSLKNGSAGPTCEHPWAVIVFVVIYTILGVGQCGIYVVYIYIYSI